MHPLYTMIKTTILFYTYKNANMKRCQLPLDLDYFKILPCLLLLSSFTNAQPTMETGGQKMPNEWIDKATGHKVIRLTRRAGNNMSFYFHNNPFVGDKMIFYGTDYLNTSKNDSVKQETGNIPANNKQLYSVDLKTLKVDQL